MSCGTVAELVKDAVSTRLLHLGVDVVARISELGDLLGEQLNSIDRVTKNNTLIDLKL